MKRKYPHIFMAILLLVLLWSSPVLAREDKVVKIDGSDITYRITYSQSNVKLIVSGKGAIPDLDEDHLLSGEYYNVNDANDVREIIVEEGVTSIGAYGLTGFTNVTKLTLPSTLKTIGYRALSRLYDLPSITIPKNVKSIDPEAFWWSSGITKYVVSPYNTVYKSKGGFILTDGGKTAYLAPPGTEGELTVPAGVEKIDSRALYDLSYVTVINIPASVKDIEVSNGDGQYVFAGVPLIQEFVVDEGNTVYSSYEGALYKDSSDELICWPRGKKGAVVFREGTKGIGSYAIYDLHESRYEDMILPESLENIRSFAFYMVGGSVDGVTLNIPKNVKNIEYRAFDNSIYKSFEVDGENEYYSSVGGNILSKDKTTFHFSSVDGIIPEGVKNISPYATTLCLGRVYKDLVIPEGVEVISDRAFYDSPGIEGVTFPKTLKYVGDEAFFHCNDITELTFYENVEYIGASAFHTAEGLKKVVFYGNAPEITDADSAEFSFDNKESLYVFFEPEKTGWTEPEWNGYKTFPMKVSGKFSDTVSWKYDISSGICVVSGAGAVPDKGDMENDEVWRNLNRLFPFRELIVEEGITSIGEGSFRSIYTDSVKLPESLESIGKRAFFSCSMKTINMPSKVTVIEEETFRYCTELEEFPISNSIVSIGIRAYETAGTKTRPDLVIPESVMFIGECAFANTYVNTLRYESRMETIGDSAFAGVRIMTPVDLVLPEGVVTIGDSAFSGIAGIKSITLPSTCRKLCDYAVSSAGEIILNFGLEEIGHFVFGGSDGKDIIIPSTVKKIGKGSFADYYSFGRLNLYFNGDTPEVDVDENESYIEGTVYYVEGTSGWTTPTWYGATVKTWEGSETIDAQKVAYYISNLGEITYSNRQRVATVRARYDSLPDEEKVKVTNIDVLIAAEEKVQEIINAEIGKVISEIGSLGEITFENHEKVASVRKAYEKLSDEDKAKVTNLDVLLSAEKKVEEVIGQEVTAVISMIGSIGDDVLEEKDRILEAMAAYEALGAYGDRVTNYDVLKKKYDELMSYSVGDVNADGEINALDATQILRYANGKSSVIKDGDEKKIFVADVNKDGSINALDATQILRYANGKSSVIQ